MLPQLRALEQELLTHREARNRKPQIDELRTLINEIETSTDAAELQSLR